MPLLLYHFKNVFLEYVPQDLLTIYFCSFSSIKLSGSNLKTPVDNNSTMVKLEKIPDDERADSSDSSVDYMPVTKKIKIDKISPKKEIGTSISAAPKRLPVKNVSFNLSRSLNTSVPDSSKNQLVLEQFLDRKEFTLVTDVGRCKVSEEDDVWLVQCPQNLDINSLAGLNFLQKDKNNFKIGNSSYECVASKDNNRDKLSLLIPPTEPSGNYKMNTLELNGVFFIRERVHNINDIEVCEQPAEKVPFPSNLKKRHPLLGVNYHKISKIPKYIREKLANPVNNYKKLKKAKKIKEEEIIEEEIVEDVQLPGKTKRKGKSQHLNLEESVEAPKKIKKENANKWTSELSIEKSLFDLPVKSEKRKSIK